MNLIKELRLRHVPQYLSAYIVASWGLIQFLAFLETRILFSPHVVNLLTLVLVCFLPSIIILAWRHGKPGPDGWKMAEKIGIPINLLFIMVVAVVLFAGKDFGSMTQTVTVSDEEGQVVERTMPKSEYG